MFRSRLGVEGIRALTAATLICLLSTGCATTDVEHSGARATTRLGSTEAAGSSPTVMAQGSVDPGAPVTTTKPRPPFPATTTSALGRLLALDPASCAIQISAQFPPTNSVPDSTPQPSVVTTTLPIDARTAIEILQIDPRVGTNTLSASVWVDGLGEVAAVNPDATLVPASNQKLFTAIGALRLLDPKERLHTDVIETGPVEDGVLKGDLVLVGGGDPTLTRTGDHSLEAIARAVTDSGIRSVEGRLLVDDSRYDNEHSRPGWPSDSWKSIGAMSSLVADHNSYRQDAAFMADPALANATLLEFALKTAGVTVNGDAAHGAASSGVRVASLESPTINELVTLMLFRSDNLIAEMLVKEIGARDAHGQGTTDAGLRAIERVLAKLCVRPVAGTSVDGSGLSRDNRRSARELRRLLLASQLQTWGPLFISDLSLAGQPDALGGRLRGPDTAGNVRAKGGSLGIARSLSGYLSTKSGRHVVFSVIVNGGDLSQVDAAIDDFVSNLAALRT